MHSLAKEAIHPIMLYPTAQFHFLKVIFYHTLKCICLSYVFVRILHQKASLVAQTIKSLLAMQETWVRSLGREDPLEKETVTLSCLENPLDRGAWWATVHRVAKNQTGLSD